MVATGCLCSLIATVGGLIVLASGPEGGGMYVGALLTVVFLAQTAVVAGLFAPDRNGD